MHLRLNVAIGKGAVVMANAVINTGSVVEHDNMIGDCAHISPDVAFGGAVRVGTVILKPITESGTYVGVPARKIV